MSKAEVKCKSLSHVQLFVTSWIVACRAPLSMEFSRQEYWSGSHSHLQGIFPTLESNLGLPHCRQILYCLSHQESPLKYVKELVNSEGLTYGKCYESNMEE